MKSVAIIPARGGSKRISRKNIKDFLGKPIIAYSIETALESGLFDEVMVSTDDEEIVTIAKKYGANVPFMRSEQTSNDFATTADVINEVLTRYENSGKRFDIVGCIYATAPFVIAENLQKGFEAIIKGGLDSAFPCVAFSYPVQRGLVFGNDGFIGLKWPEYRNSRSQDLEKFYHDAGQFYISKVDAFRKYNGFWGPRTSAIILDELMVQDLDTLTDWALAEMKYKLLCEKK